MSHFLVTVKITSVYYKIRECKVCEYYQARTTEKWKETSLSPNNSLLFCRIAGWPIAFFICETETAVRCCETDMNY